MGSEQQTSIEDAGTIILRRQLPLLGTYVPPRTPTEQTLAEIWRRALGMDQVGITDPYEDLGGDSLLAASIFVEIEQTFKVAMPTATLVDAPTIETLARRIEALVSK